MRGEQKSVHTWAILADPKSPIPTPRPEQLRSYNVTVQDVSADGHVQVREPTGRGSVDTLLTPHQVQIYLAKLITPRTEGDAALMAQRTARGVPLASGRGGDIAKRLVDNAAHPFILVHCRAGVGRMGPVGGPGVWYSSVSVWSC